MHFASNRSSWFNIVTVNQKQVDTLDQLHKDFRAKARREKALFLQRYFKTGPGEYGQGDLFIGVMVPETRSIARQYRDLPLAEIEELLHAKIHEERLAALIILEHQFKKGDQAEKKAILDLYLRNTGYINNWDLVDESAATIVGAYLLLHPNKQLLTRLARSKSLWERRMAIIATFAFIKQGKPEETLRIATMLLKDDHDLIHKAVGWMLREVGARCSPDILETFLKQHSKTMPRTMLRYAIEHFSPEKRQQYLKKLT